MMEIIPKRIVDGRPIVNKLLIEKENADKTNTTKTQE